MLYSDLRRVAGDEPPAPTLIHGATSWVRSATFSPDADGERIVLGSDDGLGIVVDSSHGAPIADLRGHDGGIVAAEVLPDRRIVTASRDGTARIWHLPDQQVFDASDWAHDADIDEEGDLLVAAGGPGRSSAGR